MSDHSQNQESQKVKLSHEKFKWFAVLTQPGMEKRAIEGLQTRIKKHNMSEYFGQIIIPSQMVEKIDAQGKKKQVEQKMMPGYIFIQLDPAQVSVFGFVKETPKISAFIGASHHQVPYPVPEEELDRIFNRSKYVTEEKKQKPKTIFEKGEKVKVIEGPFTNFVGDIDEVKPDKMKLRLLISVFGRATPVEIEFSKVEKYNEESEES
jgi:transcriptional antiterminator NusG